MINATNNNLCKGNCHLHGFTILELMIALAIIGFVSAVALPNFDDWVLKKAIKNGHQEVIANLYEARSAALSENTTARVILTGAAGNYVMTAFLSNAPTNVCTAAGGVWAQLYSRSLSLPSAFAITGAGLNNNVCFYRDRTSTGSTYNIAQVGGGTEYGSSTLTVTVATGFLDGQYTAP